MNIEEIKNKYSELFTVGEKAAAFDKIAENFYFCNFGSLQKSDLETMMFSLYIDEILKETESDFNSYSDYTLSKLLGISQTKISNLKVRKELKYPFKDFDWKKSFARVCGNAKIESGKIKIFIPDQNLYLELKNQIESNGGYVDVTLNSKLLKIAPEYFVDLMLSISDETDRKKMQGQIIKTLKEKDRNFDVQNSKSPRKAIIKQIEKMGFSVVTDVLGALISEKDPVAGVAVMSIIKSIIPVITGVA